MGMTNRSKLPLPGFRRHSPHPVSAETRNPVWFVERNWKLLLNPNLYPKQNPKTQFVQPPISCSSHSLPLPFISYSIHVINTGQFVLPAVDSLYLVTTAHFMLYI